MFATVLVAVLDPAAGRLQHANAGHPAALLLRPAAPELPLAALIGDLAGRGDRAYRAPGQRQLHRRGLPPGARGGPGLTAL